MKNVMSYAILNMVKVEGFIKEFFGKNLTKVERQSQHKKDVALKPFLDEFEVENLLKEAKKRGHQYYPIWAIALSTGIRNSELQALKWEDVDMGKGTINVVRYMNKNNNRYEMFHTGCSRKISITPFVREILLELRNSSTSEFVLPRIKSWVAGYNSQIFKLFLKEIGIKDVSANSLRQSWATMELKNSVPCNEAKRLLELHQKATANTYKKNLNSIK
ncbi:MAG: site-specific integrase [Bacteriovoracaceae bacterium]|nr:site-specific integrase [Bacteriovoracaceae bacterium]